jgi:outer membrane protein assembly factor BamB
MNGRGERWTMKRSRRHFPSKTAFRLPAVLACLAGAVLAAPTALALVTPDAAHASGPAVTSSEWTTFDQNSLRTGADPSGNPLFPAKSAWTASVDGALYGQPLVATGRVFVATENDTVYALAANSGTILWSNHVATPVESASLPCGNIGPTVGVTGTPVIDTARTEIFVVADEAVPAPAIASHHLIGLDIYTGAVELDQVIDPAGSYPPAQLQRASLALDDGAVIAGFGGNAGDCSTYHGLVIATPETGGPTSVFTVSNLPGDSQGAVWMGGAAPTVDAHGNVWVATGNSAFNNASDTYDQSDGVLELSSSMALLQDFTPAAWYSDNATDKDLGSTAPALLPNGLVFEVGKSTTAYVLSQSDLGGVDGQVALTNNFCFADGGSADVNGTLYVPCKGGITAVTPSTSPPTGTWTTSTGAHNSPIVAGGEVWSMDGAGNLYGLDPSTGSALQSFTIGSSSSDFPSPSAADGLVLAPSSKAVHAFEGPDGLPAPPSPQGVFAISTASLPDAKRGTAYGPITLQESGAGTSRSPYVTTFKWKRVSVPRGLRLSSTGVLAGTPSARLNPGPSSVTVQVTEKVITLNGRSRIKIRTTVQATIPLNIT